MKICRSDELSRRSGGTVTDADITNFVLDMKIENPVLAGDTLHVQCEVIEARLSKSRPGRGLASTLNKVVKQDGKVALTYTPLRMIKCRGDQQGST